MASEPNQNPLSDLEDWDHDVRRRYPEPDKPQAEFRNYSADAKPHVRDFYRLNHRFQSVEFVRQKHEQYLPLQTRKMSIWEGLMFLNTLVDDSDPDTDLPQIEHAMQTAEAIRAAGHPRWFILTGLIHDLGKVLCLFGEPQWAVVGDTFPVGCEFSSGIVFPEFFADNPDYGNPDYSSRFGIYSENCGLDQVLMSWGHDEYLYRVTREYLPEPAQYMIRYHSFYAGHRERAYDHLMNEHDQEMFAWVRKFNPFDLYTKSEHRLDVEKLTPFYQELVDEYFPSELNW